MKKYTLSLFRVIYRFRRQRKYKNEKWLPKYKWRSATDIVRCHNQAEVHNLISQHVDNSHTGKHQVQIFETEKIELLKEAASSRQTQ